MRKYILLFILFVLSFTNAEAVKTVINGKAKGAENLEIRFYIWDDYISFKEVLLQKSKIDEKGNFTFNIDMRKNEVICGFFRIMNYTSSMIYLSAESQYELNFTPFDYKDPNRIYIPFLSKIGLDYQINTIDTNDLNFLVGKFNVEYNDFISNKLGIRPDSQNRANIRVRRSKIDTFAIKCEEMFHNINNSYFDSYRKYTYAEMLLTFNSMSKKQIYDEYINKQPVLFDNMQYMNFFTQYYEDYILGSSRSINTKSIVSNVNVKPDIVAIIDSIGRDTFLRNEVVRETVLVMNLKNWFADGLNKKNIISLLQTYAINTKFDILARISQNIVFGYTKYSTDSKISKFNFFNYTGDEFNNDSLVDRPTYFLFFTTWSKPCLSELNALNKLKEQWVDSVRFIGVCMDFEPLKLYYFEQENKFTYPLYHFNNDFVFAEETSLMAYPQAMMVDKEMHFIKHIAPLPSEGLNDFLTKMFAPPKKEEIKVGH